jgi:predicted dehydrogenase
MRQAHMPAWAALRDAGRVELAAACDVNRASADSLAKQYQVPHVFEDFGDLFRRVELDLVDIATPNMFHVPAALAAFKAG